VLFPASEGGESVPAEVPAAPATPSAQAGRTPLILVVDDEDIVRAPCEENLRRNGYAVIGAAHGEEALRIFTRRWQEIDCVVLDLTMPGMSGAVVFREMKRIDPNVSVILTSGFSEQAALETFATDQPSGFIQKPYRLETLLGLIEQSLGEL